MLPKWAYGYVQSNEEPTQETVEESLYGVIYYENFYQVKPVGYFISIRKNNEII